MDIIISTFSELQESELRTVAHIQQQQQDRMVFLERELKAKEALVTHNVSEIQHIRSERN